MHVAYTKDNCKAKIVSGTSRVLPAFHGIVCQKISVTE
jgi:hypothetical protein